MTTGNKNIDDKARAREEMACLNIYLIIYVRFVHLYYAGWRHLNIKVYHIIHSHIQQGSSSLRRWWRRQRRKNIQQERIWRRNKCFFPPSVYNSLFLCHRQARRKNGRWWKEPSAHTERLTDWVKVKLGGCIFCVQVVEFGACSKYFIGSPTNQLLFPFFSWVDDEEDGNRDPHKKNYCNYFGSVFLFFFTQKNEV